MIAMVMCAGLGTRLRPLTNVLPKPMVPVANKPVLEHTLENLRRNGIREAVVNLSYRPQVIQTYFGDGSKWGMKIHYSIEHKLMGTAGGVKKAEKIFQNDPDPDFLITSGDGLTDIQFSSLIEYHRRKKSFGTMALKKIDSRMEYGVTITDRSGRIKKFVEKPYWSDVFSNSVNTGIYLFNKKVLDEIPSGSFYDFGKQLWPALLKKKKAIYGFEFDAFWTDIGNIVEYRHAQKAVLDKEVSVHIDGKEIRKGVWIDENSSVHPEAKLTAPCIIGKYCNIGKNATIGAYTVIGHGAKIDPEATIQNSTLWNEVEVKRKVHLDHCVIAMRGKVSESISITEGTILDVHG